MPCLLPPPFLCLFRRDLFLPSFPIAWIEAHVTPRKGFFSLSPSDFPVVCTSVLFCYLFQVIQIIREANGGPFAARPKTFLLFFIPLVLSSSFLALILALFFSHKCYIKSSMWKSLTKIETEFGKGSLIFFNVEIDI